MAMSAKELINQLQQLDPETSMFLWVDGERYNISSVDSGSYFDEWYADINAVIEEA